MPLPVSRSLIPVDTSTPERAGREESRPNDGFDLVHRETHLRDSVDVERYLPDILGRALARIWIDPIFRDQFAAGPVETLAAYDVHLPESITIDFVTENTPRPQVVVYEQRRPGGPRRRLLYLRLVMMAGR
ncbi:MAG: hypothetical protein JJ872_11715 [Marivivens sp.]|jgi:hypothetical protein|nr:hypothetical protein [Marivivens sp.]